MKGPVQRVCGLIVGFSAKPDFLAIRLVGQFQEHSPLPDGGGDYQLFPRAFFTKGSSVIVATSFG